MTQEPAMDVRVCAYSFEGRTWVGSYAVALDGQCWPVSGSQIQWVETTHGVKVTPSDTGWYIESTGKRQWVISGRIHNAGESA